MYIFEWPSFTRKSWQYWTWIFRRIPLHNSEGSRCVYCFALFPHCCPCSEAQQRAFHLQQTENADRFVALWSWGSFPCGSYQLPWKDVKCYSTAFMEIMNKNQGKQYKSEQHWRPLQSHTAASLQPPGARHCKNTFLFISSDVKLQQPGSPGWIHLLWVLPCGRGNGQGPRKGEGQELSSWGTHGEASSSSRGLLGWSVHLLHGHLEDLQLFKLQAFAVLHENASSMSIKSFGTTSSIYLMFLNW